MTYGNRIYCNRCGTTTRINANYCTGCGNLLNPGLRRGVRGKRRGSKIGFIIVAAIIGFFLFGFCDNILTSIGTYEESDFTTEPVHQRNLHLKIHMLARVNDARKGVGVPTVKLGTNNAAQLHAEQGVKYSRPPIGTHTASNPT